MPAIMMADPGNLGGGRQYSDHNGDHSQGYPGPAPPVDKMRRMQDLENLRNMLIAWNANRLDLFELSMPNEVSLKQKIVFNGLRVFHDSTFSGGCKSTMIECGMVCSHQW